MCYYSEDLKIEEINSGSFRVSFKSAYIFGDFVSYKSEMNGEGKGKIIDITVQEDGTVYYVILLDDGTGAGGITAEEMKLIRRDYKS